MPFHAPWWMCCRAGLTRSQNYYIGLRVFLHLNSSSKYTNIRTFFRFAERCLRIEMANYWKYRICGLLGFVQARHQKVNVDDYKHTEKKTKQQRNVQT